MYFFENDIKFSKPLIIKNLLKKEEEKEIENQRKELKQLKEKMNTHPKSPSIKLSFTFKETNQNNYNKINRTCIKLFKYDSNKI